MAVAQPRKINWQLILAFIGLLIPITYNFGHANYINGQNEQIIKDIQRDIQDLQNYRAQSQKLNDKMDVRLDQLQLDEAILKTRFDDYEHKK